MVRGASDLAPVVLRKTGGLVSSDGRCSDIGGRQVVFGRNVRVPASVVLRGVAVRFNQAALGTTLVV